MDNRDVAADKHISRFVVIFEITQGVWTTSQQPNFKLHIKTANNEISHNCHIQLTDATCVRLQVSGWYHCPVTAHLFPWRKVRS